MIIIVSGTPGTGKTKVAKAMASALGYYYVDVKKLIEDKRLSEGFDGKRGCLIVDQKKLNKSLIALLLKKKNAVIDSHLSHYLPKKYVDRCVVTTCKLKELERRLKKRKYSREKIRENLDAEIFEVCKIEALEAGHLVSLLDTTKGFDLDTLIESLRLVESG